MAATTARRRHRWIRLRVHAYICERCGCGKVNTHTGGGGWVQVYHTSDGRASAARQVPECVKGLRTSAALKKYESVIGVGGLRKERQGAPETPAEGAR